MSDRARRTMLTRKPHIYFRSGHWSIAATSWSVPIMLRARARVFCRRLNEESA